MASVQFNNANGNTYSDSNKGVSYKWDYNNILSGAYFEVGTQDFTRTASGLLLCRTYSPNAIKAEISPEPFKPTPLRASIWGGGIWDRPTFTPIIYHYHKYGHYEYTDEQLTRINTSTGYRDSLGTHVYVRDWQGNVRAVVSRDGGTTVFDQTTYYYPYGLPMAESTSPQTNPYKYTAKELLTDRALNLADHGARFYDPAIARWLSTDPLGYENTEYTLYNMVFSDPIRFVDMTGLIGWDAVENFLSFLPDEVRSHTMTLLKGVVEKDGVALSRIAVGVERNRTLSATSGAELEASYVNGVVMFLGGDDAGYLYTYTGGEFGAGAEVISAGLTLNTSLQVFIAVQNETTPNHQAFEGRYTYGRFDCTGELPVKLLGASTSYGVSQGVHPNNQVPYWTVYSKSLGLSVGVGESPCVTVGAVVGGGNIKFSPFQNVGAPKSFLQIIASRYKLFFPLL